jgi:transposase
MSFPSAKPQESSVLYLLSSAPCSRVRSGHFVEFLKKRMRYRKKALHLVLDDLPAHKAPTVKNYVSRTNGRLTLYYPPDYAPELNPDELVWSHVKRTGMAGNPLRKRRETRAKDS